MKRMRNILAIGLALALMMGVLSGCSLLGGVKLEELEGTWSTVKTDAREEAMVLLKNINAYEEEIALVDLDSLMYVKVVGFTADKQYYFGYDVEGTKACVRDFYDRYFDALYEGRTALNEVYAENFDGMSREQFRQYYAELYGYGDYRELLDNFSFNAYDYEALKEPIEFGTFRISGNDILCTIAGQGSEEVVEAAIDEDTLTLLYVDGTEIYTRAD